MEYCALKNFAEMRGYEANFDGDDEDFDFLLDFDDEDAACFAAAQHLDGKDARGPKFLRKRAGWEEGLKMLRATGQFRSRCHMPEPTFNKLVEILRDDLPVDELQPRRSSGGNKPISVEVIVGMGLRLMLNPSSLIAICCCLAPKIFTLKGFSLLWCVGLQVEFYLGWARFSRCAHLTFDVHI